ncbi:MAG: class D beta-lactamase [Comamonas sp.]|jgi:beta-lactamase class D|nr:class D beta-lactamase [Comamonas sp.]
MNRRKLIFTALVAGLIPVAQAAQPQEKTEWLRLFAEEGVEGSIAVLDARSEPATLYVHNAARAAQRFSPASTFKIPHSLFALDAGLLRDEFQLVPWDGVKRSLPAWNGDQNLRSAMRNSTIWVYERIAQELGDAREASYLQKTGYGNAVVAGGKPFWVEGDLAISALEQIGFLQRLYRNQLPFKVEHQRLVKDVMINEAGPDWILRAKTGWTGSIGWWVGWMEWPTGPVFFALNIDTPNRLGDLAKRQSITRNALRSINALPAP